MTTATHERRPVFLDFFAGCAVGRCCEDPLLLGDAQMLAWVLMPDHVHWLLQLGERDDLSTVVNRLKSSSSRHANRVLGQSGTIWQKSFHDHALRAEEDQRKVARYIVANPLREKGDRFILALNINAKINCPLFLSGMRPGCKRFSSRAWVAGMARSYEIGGGV